MTQSGQIPQARQGPWCGLRSPQPPVATRLTQLPPYLFAKIDAAKREARAAGKNLVDLGVGDPDQPTPAFIIRAMAKAIRDPANHRYALDQGMPELREAIAGWYRRRFGVTLDPQREILPLIGSKEGIAHLPFAFLNPGDRALIPDPCYPPYRTCTILAGGHPVSLPLAEDHDFLPDPAQIRREANDRLKKLLKDHQVSEDQERQGLDEVQKVTDRYIQLVDELQKKKDAELLGR